MPLAYVNALIQGSLDEGYGPPTYVVTIGGPGNVFGNNWYGFGKTPIVQYGSIVNDGSVSIPTLGGFTIGSIVYTDAIDSFRIEVEGSNVPADLFTTVTTEGGTTLNVATEIGGQLGTYRAFVWNGVGSWAGWQSVGNTRDVVFA